jgi:SAM-dependent methyltransferase
MADLQRAVVAAGRQAQFGFAAADFFHDVLEIAEPFDVVLVANVCHLFDGQLVERLLRLAASAVNPQGRLVVLDQVLDEQPDWLRWSAVYAVGLPHWGPGGYLYTLAEYRVWLERAGLASIRAQALCPQPAVTLIAARRLELTADHAPSTASG